MKFRNTYAKAKSVKKILSATSREKNYEQRDERLIRELVKASGNRVRNILEQSEATYA